MFVLPLLMEISSINPFTAQRANLPAAGYWNERLFQGRSSPPVAGRKCRELQGRWSGPSCWERISEFEGGGLRAESRTGASWRAEQMLFVICVHRASSCKGLVAVSPLALG